MGHNSRLITFSRHHRGYEEDICLNLPLFNFPGLYTLKKLISDRNRITISNTVAPPNKIPLYWKPHGSLEKLFIRLRETIWSSKIKDAISQVKLADADVIQLDGGLDFYRDGHLITDMKQCGKKIICCYTGSDLRVRGVIPAIDTIADLNVTVEFDHQLFHPNIHHVFFPFDWKSMPTKKQNSSETIRIGHAPTYRAAKGSDIIIPALEKLRSQYPIEIVLIENMTYKEALAVKASCDIFVDQIGDLGYGINSLEAMAMGIPSASCLASGFAEQYPDHPFIEINGENIIDQLIPYIQSVVLRNKSGDNARTWVQKHHDAKQVVQKIHKLAGLINVQE